MSGRTLYVSDLDGTLLRSDEKTSAFTNEVINSLVNQGVYFSYATARSFVTSAVVTKGLDAKIPVVVYNGAFVLDTVTNEILVSNFFTESEVLAIRKLLESRGVHPIVYSVVNGSERFSYQVDRINQGMRFFVDSRKEDVRNNPVELADDLYAGQVFYFTCIGSEELLKPMYDDILGRFNCVYQKDIYSGEPWLEILPQNATKANAILQLKEYFGCDKIVSFGDGKNDISMFAISDECYAVANAVEKLKEIATGIIDGNDQDGVAKWLKKNVLVD